jgi:hypothetical protein
MSSRDSGNVWAFYKQENGLYDLNRWNDEYWRRFETFLVETSAKRDIIVQIEIWATFDYYRDNWDINPFNPKNNINYEPRRSKLTEVVETHPIFTENNFFRSVPSQMALAQVLWYQQQFVDRILSYTLRYGHVLYCMDNETSVTADWGKLLGTLYSKTGRTGRQESTYHPDVGSLGIESSLSCRNLRQSRYVYVRRYFPEQPPVSRRPLEQRIAAIRETAKHGVPQACQQCQDLRK